MYIRTPYTELIATCEQFLNPTHGVCRVSESLLYFTTWYRMCILIPYIPVPRVPEGLLYPAAWYHVYILTPQVCVGCQKVLCLLLHGPYVFIHILGVCRVSESHSLMYSTAWYHAYIRTPYTPERGVFRVKDSLMYSAV